MEEQEEQVDAKPKDAGWRTTAIIVLALLLLAAIGAWIAVEKFLEPTLVSAIPPTDGQPPDVEDPVPDILDENVITFPLHQQQLTLQPVGEIEIPPLVSIIPVLAIDPQDYTQEEIDAELQRRSAEFDTIVIMVFSSKTYDDLKTVEGKQRALQEILEAVDARMGKGRIVNVFVQEFSLRF